MAVIKLVENWSVNQLRSQVRDSLQYHGEECILLSLYHSFSDPDAPRCPRCTNDAYMSGENACPVCYGTSFDGGVKESRRVWGLFTDHIASEQLATRGEYQPDSREVQCEPFPMLIEHDVIVRVRHWDINHKPLHVEGYYVIQAVTKDSLRTGNRFGQTSQDVVGQKATVTRLADNVGIAAFPVIGVDFPECVGPGIHMGASSVYEPGQVCFPRYENKVPETITFFQTTPSAVWTITHDLGHLPDVTVIVGGEAVLADVSYPDIQTVVITFALPQTGEAVLA